MTSHPRTITFARNGSHTCIDVLVPLERDKAVLRKSEDKNAD